MAKMPRFPKKPDKATDREGIDEDGRSKFTVRHNKWDREDYQHVRDEVGKLVAATDALGQIITEDKARPEMSDVFMLFMKAAPDFYHRTQVQDGSRPALSVNESLKDVDEFSQLRRFTRGDMVGSALAAVRLEPTLETLFDRIKKQQEKAEELAKKRKELRDLIKKQLQKQRKEKGEKQDGPEGDTPVDMPGQPGGDQEGEGEGEGQGVNPAGTGGEDVPDNIEELIEELEQQVSEMEAQMEEELADAQEGMSATLSEAMQEAVEAAQGEQQSARAWGLEPGQLQRLPADVRLKLAARMNQDRLRRISELFGPMHNLAIAPRQRRVEDIPHEIKRVTVGNNLNHLTVEELIAMDDEDLEMDWLKRFANRSLRQYKMDGTERVGKGGLVICLDSSGSMGGNPELMSKAVMLTLLNICKKDGREFVCIHFGSRGQMKEFTFRRPEDYRADHVIDAAEFFFGGGTDFESPLNRAIEVLEEENRRTGRVRSDIVFLTDGMCGVSDKWKENFRSRLEAMDAACWGIAIGCPPTSQPLNDICGGQVCSVSDLQNAGKEIKTIFAGVQR